MKRRGVEATSPINVLFVCIDRFKLSQLGAPVSWEISIGTGPCLCSLDTFHGFLLSPQVFGHQQIICCPIFCVKKHKTPFFQSCDNMVCGDCVGQLSHCPLCRQDFGERPAARNRFAERLLLNNA